MDNEKLLSDEEYKKRLQKDDNPANLKETLEGLGGILDMFQSFIDSESEGMIICENCLDNVYEDDEDVCTAEDANGFIHAFCCEACMNEWKKGH